MSTGQAYHDRYFKRVCLRSAASKEGRVNVAAVVHVISVIKSIAKPHLSWCFITCPIERGKFHCARESNTGFFIIIKDTCNNMDFLEKHTLLYLEEMLWLCPG